MAGGSLRRAPKVQTVIMKKEPSKLQKVAKDVSKLKKQMKDAEYKFFDLSLSPTEVSATSTVTFLNAIPVGNTNVSHVGAQYNIKSIEIKFRIELTGTSSLDTCRVALVRYKSINEATPTYSTGNHGIYESEAVTAVRQLDNKNDFIILKEWNILLNDVGNPNRYYTYYKKMNNKTVVKTGQSGTAASQLEQNGYFLVTLGQIALVGDNSQLNGVCRFRFTDQ